MPSSYRKPIKGQKDDCNVLEPAFPACIALVFCWMPLSVFLVITAATDFSQLFQVVTVVSKVLSENAVHLTESAL